MGFIHSDRGRSLAAADSLDYLLYPNVSVIIPDAVFYEATRDSAKLGAQSILDWVKGHHAQVEIAVTNAYVNFDVARIVNPQAYEPNLGERAAVEVIEEPARLQGDDKAILLCEETAVSRRVIVRERDKIIELSTIDFLKLWKPSNASSRPMPSSNARLRPAATRRGWRNSASTTSPCGKPCGILCGPCNAARPQSADRNICKPRQLLSPLPKRLPRMPPTAAAPTVLATLPEVVACG
jgi:hypothetical protein